MMPIASISPRFADYRRHVDELVGATVAAADPEAAVGRFLRREGRTLWVGHGPEAEAIDLDHSRVYLIAAGKAAIPMTAGVMAVLGADVAGGVVIAKAGGSEWPAAAAQWPLASIGAATRCRTTAAWPQQGRSSSCWLKRSPRMPSSA